jgi:hypothetical protein
MQCSSVTGRNVMFTLKLHVSAVCFNSAPDSHNDWDTHPPLLVFNTLDRSLGYWTRKHIKLIDAMLDYYSYKIAPIII